MDIWMGSRYICSWDSLVCLVSSYNCSCLLDLVSLKSAADFISGNFTVKLTLVTKGRETGL